MAQADISLLPFMERFDLVMREFLGMRLETLHSGSIQTWLEAMQELPSCRTASADSSLLLEAYRCCLPSAQLHLIKTKTSLLAGPAQ